MHHITVEDAKLMIGAFKKDVDAARLKVKREEKQRRSVIDISDECLHLERDLETSKDMGHVMAPLRTFVDNCLCIFLNYFGVQVDERVPFNDKEKLIARVDDNFKGELFESRPCFLIQQMLATIRSCTNLHVHGTPLTRTEMDIVTKESFFVVDVFLNRILSLNGVSSKEQEIKPSVKLDKKEGNSNNKVKHEDPSNSNTRYEKKISKDGVVKNKPKEVKEDKNSSKTEPKNSKSKKSKNKVFPCMFGACAKSGDCRIDGHDHSNDEESSKTYYKIGIHKCFLGSNCLFYKMKIKLPNGNVTDACLYLHDNEKENTIKKRIALGWNCFIHGLIPKDKILSDDDISQVAKQIKFDNTQE